MIAPTSWSGVARLPLAHLPTPLEAAPRLGEAMGVDLWIKRDDATGGPEAGNKIRKLEFLLADALARDCDTVITCGGLQSNHARATAVLAARLGMHAVVMLRDAEPASALELEGNVFLDHMVGAEIRRVTRAEYLRRDDLMADWAEELRASGRRPYVIPEGGSNGLGAIGYLRAMEETRAQLDALGHGVFDVVVHGCGSGGTAAGVVLGAQAYRVARRLVAFAVCDDAPTFERRIAAIIDEARALLCKREELTPFEIDERGKGPAYGVSTPAQRNDMIAAARLSGLVLDPVYSGKALHGLWQRCREGDRPGQRVLFIHTGGLPGLLAQASAFR